MCDALYKAKKLKYISCHHEQAVAYATESYSRARNKPGAAIVTTGPGGTNCVSGVAYLFQIIKKWHSPTK